MKKPRQGSDLMSKNSLAQKPEQKREKIKDKEKNTFPSNLQENLFLPTECMMSDSFANAKSPQKVFWGSIAEVFCSSYYRQYDETSLLD